VGAYIDELLEPMVEIARGRHYAFEPQVEHARALAAASRRSGIRLRPPEKRGAASPLCSPSTPAHSGFKRREIPRAKTEPAT
jgi:hypothetical protein